MKIKINPSEIKALVPMPVSVIKLASMANDPRARIDEMARIIEYDEALTANLLRLANSIWARGRMPVVSVKDAVVRLGAVQVLQLCVGKQVATPMSKPLPGYELGEHDLWRHSVASAIAADHLNIFMQQSSDRLAFTAALVHDIGKLMMGRYIKPETLDEIHRLMAEENIPFKEAEHLLLGTDHAEVGKAIAEYWKFPKQLINAIEFHHDPDKEPDALVDVVHLSNILAKRIGVGVGTLYQDMEVSEVSARRLGASSEDLEAICEQVSIELDAAEKIYLGKVGAV